ncbi:hypothetical protein E2F50_00145 [Rhizobium deserti]|uniref:Uncharacterized protein n=1 Tax=Rhizobium deserti TaxID=2547961 RepID=A0A4R5ULC8_9HYPH|nr:hypothetical protein [Rhizobium deserti]TDK38611.1 hypothetical protein E2F50_00145 [Rhizobium deserti]
MTDRRAQQLCEALRVSLRTGKRPALPAGGDILWTWFSDLHAARRYGMNGPDPLAFSDIRAYFELYRIPAEPHHVSILRAMDGTYLEHAFASRDGTGGATVRQPSSDLTAAGFDAIFG